MGEIKRENTRRMLLFVVATAVAFLLNSVTGAGSGLPYRVPSVLFACIIAAWTYSVSERVLHKRIRFYLMFGGYSLISLFAIRICRWNFLYGVPQIERFLWYAYYIPIIIVPICSLGAALCISRSEETGSDKYLWLFWLAGAVMAVLVLSNDSHHLFMVIREGERADHRFLYYMIVLFGVGLVAGSFILAMRKCTLSASRKLWYIPVSAAALGVALLLLYFYVGGSPTIAGRKLYYMQEVYALTFIGFLEGCIQIGLIPSNYGYSFFFEEADLEAWIEDKDHNVIYETAKNRNRNTDDGRRIEIKMLAIQGGTVHWVEDYTSIAKLRDEIREAIERIEEENTLIEYENETKARQAEIDARSRLYDRIADITAPWVEELKYCMEMAEKDSDNEKYWIGAGASLCACIKRRANLELISFENQRIPIRELYVSIKEVNDYISRTGAEGDVRLLLEGDVPSYAVLRSFGIFVRAAERAMKEKSAVSVILSGDKGYYFRLVMETGRESLLNHEEIQVLEGLGLSALEEMQEGISYITVRTGEGGIDNAV